ncbi:hypothetical protein RB595_001330 [Gaeumannomyces hyphopodioides]
MPAKRKRDILDFDVNKSDSDDENFEPGLEREEKPRRAAGKRSRSIKGRPPGRRRDRYGGSDIDDDDDDDIIEDSEPDYMDDDDEDDEDAPVNATGRRMRKVAAQQHDYKEKETSEEEEADIPSEDEDVEDDDELAPKKKKPSQRASRPSKIVTLKYLRSARAQNMEPPTPGVTTRRTRARTEEAEEFVELSTSGKHVRSTRAGTRSKSPEAFSRTARATKGLKGLKKLPPPIEEVTQESSVPDPPQPEELTPRPDGESSGDNDGGQLGVESVQDSGVETAGGESGSGDADAAQYFREEAQDLMESAEATEEVAAAAVADEEDDDDDDDAPVTRRTRATRAANIAREADDEVEEASENAAPGRRLTRRALRPKKSTQEPSSDFDPGEDDESVEGEGSAWDASSRKGRQARAEPQDDGDEDYSGQPSRGRRASQAKRTKKRVGKDSGDEEVELNQDEMLEELEELRQSSRSRRRRRSPSIAYEQPLPKRRRTAVDYSIKPLDQLMDQEEEEDATPTAAKGRRGGRAGASTTWQRSFAATYGPFGGGGGAGSLLGGPWGTGATGGVEEDSSDDEAAAVARAGVGGAVGMTPTTATGPGFGQAAGGLDGAGGVAATPNLGKVKNQKAFADADPLGVDLTVDFSKVGGLQGHIDQLKEMIMLPLLYPELFLKYKVTPPRGVLFHGPPGTGKTLLARALSNAVGIGGRKITFYMRKGADALSKWVGEAEKQLRLLFEEARRTQPSIIFFDEIDGLAPVRSSKQEQIHASIVSTLLALMDGMDGRGQVIVIGATNRPDSVDPALRRPGRFDREFYFPLPDLEGRRAILDIHTKDWGLSSEFRDTLARRTKGYGGADLRALCTEAALNSIQRTYPQIYSSTDKLIVDPERIAVHATDFIISINKMVPSSERSASSAAAPLPPSVEPLLRQQLAALTRTLDQILPRKKKATALEEAMFEPYEDDDDGFGRENLGQEMDRLRIFRPRLLVSGLPGMGQEYVSAAMLHHLEGVFVQNFDLATLLGDLAPMEQVIVRLFTEVKRHRPAVMFVPNIAAWYATLTESAYRTFVTMLRSIPATDPVLLLGTSECEASALPDTLVKDLFGFSRKNHREIARPNPENRREFFTNIISRVRLSPADFPDPANRKKRVLEELPVAPPPPPRKRTREEMQKERHTDQIALNHLKLALQPIMDQIKQKYRKFRNSVIPIQQIEYLWQEADPAYVRADLTEGSPVRPYVIDRDKCGVEGLREVETGRFFYNLDVATIEERLSNGYYARPGDFFNDIESLARDARNIGDRERTLKANELVSNVRVDVHEIATRMHYIDFNALHERQKQRALEAEEKRKKREAMQKVVDLTQAEAATEDAAGPVTIGAPVPGGATTTTSARFRVMSPAADGSTATSSQQPPSGLSNGNSVPSRAGPDVVMGGTGVGHEDNEDAAANNHAAGPDQRPVHMRPPPPHGRWTPRIHAGQTQQYAAISQVSVITTVPPGVSPSAMLNDASTTGSAEVSSISNRSSLGRWDRLSQGTNGAAPASGQGSSGHSNSQMPDTQSLGGPSQSTSSESQWAHSQAQAMARGELGPRGHGSGFGGGSGSGSGYGDPNGPASPTSSQHARRGSLLGVSSSRRGTVSLLNEAGDDSHSSSSLARVSAASSQGPVLDQVQLQQFLQSLTNRTSGCTVEQLEQINRELMEEVWNTRHEWNRNKVLGRLTSVYNETIQDIEEVQGSFPNTQETASRTHCEYGAL